MTARHVFYRLERIRDKKDFRDFDNYQAALLFIKENDISEKSHRLLEYTEAGEDLVTVGFDDLRVVIERNGHVNVIGQIRTKK